MYYVRWQFLDWSHTTHLRPQFFPNILDHRTFICTCYLGSLKNARGFKKEDFSYMLVENHGAVYYRTVRNRLTRVSLTNI